MDSRVKTPAKSLQAWAFTLGKPLLPATSSPSPSHATSPGQILSQFPGHVEAALWPSLPCWWCHDKKHRLRFDELENLISACKELLSTLCRVKSQNVNFDYAARVQVILFETCVCLCIFFTVHPCIYTLGIYACMLQMTIVEPFETVDPIIALLC